ncbi:hypothetical protein OC683_02250, partial ['Crotalaria aegyptiaca' phytoplasma]
KEMNEKEKRIITLVVSSTSTSKIITFFQPLCFNNEKNQFSYICFINSFLSNLIIILVLHKMKRW